MLVRFDEYEDFEGVRTVRMYHLNDDHLPYHMADQSSQASTKCTGKRELPALPDATVTPTQTPLETSAVQNNSELLQYF